jgi:predicted GH43/DUF377 family glycosyl hydrolase
MRQVRVQAANEEKLTHDQFLTQPMKKIRLILFLICSLPATIFADATGSSPNPGADGQNQLPAWAIGPFVRPAEEPVIKPDPNAVFDCPLSKTPIHWEKAWVYNPAAVVRDGKIIVLFRAQQGPGNTCSRVGYAESEDGIHFKTDPAPVFYPADDAQQSAEWSGNDGHGGCEDPRVTESPDGFYVLTYTQYNGKRPRLGIASSKDLRTWTKYGSAFSGSKYADNHGVQLKSASIVNEVKDGHLVAAKINGKYWMYFGEGHVNLASSDDLIHWVPVEGKDGNPVVVMKTRPGFADSRLDEIGPEPVLTDKGIVVFYNGENDDPQKHGDPSLPKSVYTGMEALFDANDPTKLIARLDHAYIKPELPFEKTGLFKAGTTFTEGLVLFKGKWFVYYGCADSLVGVAICDPAQKN